MFGSLERIAAEKASLLGSLAADGLAVLCADSEPLEKATRHFTGHVVRFGASDKADLRLSDYHADGPACRYEINAHVSGRLGLPGRHNAINALAAVAVARRFAFSTEEAVAALDGFGGTDMRLEWIDTGKGIVINDAYNANPASVAAAADVLAEAPGRRRVLILSDMLELGGDSQALHEQLGAEMARRRIDLVVGVGPLGRYLARGAAEAGLAAREYASVDSVRRALKRLLSAGDAVLLKGSRATGMERLVEPVRAALTGTGRKRASVARRSKGS
jgi:UDP-N-acetylmuramoyl-tripeptide--D-alanyl-D-alanine ligase